MGSALGIVTGKGKGSVMVTAVFLALGALFMYADRTVLYPMLEVIAADFSLSGKATGFITSTYFLLYVAMQVPAGILGDSLGLKKVLMLFYLLGGAALFALGLIASSYLFLVVLVGLHGIGMGAFYPTIWDKYWHSSKGAARFGFRCNQFRNVRWNCPGAGAVGPDLSLDRELEVALPAVGCSHHARPPSVPTLFTSTAGWQW